MRILVLGAGATGGYFGARLIEVGADVTFLVRPARAERLATGGLKVTSPEGDFHRPVTTVTAETLTATPYDLVRLSCKAYDLEPSLAAIAPAVGAQTMVLPLLNGLLHLDRLTTVFDANCILGGFCHIGVSLAANGDIRHLSRIHYLTFGEQAGPPAARTEAVAALFARANFTSRLSTNVLQEMWDKFVFLTTLAGVTCLMRANVGEIMSTREGETIMREMFDECRAVAAASGWSIPPPASDFALSQLTDHGSAFTASMLRDIEAGLRTEADHIVGDMLRRAREQDLPAPLLRLAYCHLQSHAARLLRGTPP